VPIVLNEMYEKGLLNKGDKLVLVAFGGGLTYGATVIEW
jgi:3-oxoacyl-[acyl-carrier-protein] synthase-3